MSSGPFVAIDHVVVGVRDLDAGAHAYAAMLGRTPSWRGRHPSYGTANVLFGLGNCYLELLAVEDATSTHPIATALRGYLERRTEGIFAIALSCDDLAAASARLTAAGLTPGPIADGAGIDASGATRRWRSFALDRTETRGIAVLAITHHDRAAIGLGVPTGDPRGVVHDVDHVVLFSDDLDGALALWRDVFGIAERWRRELTDRGTVNVGLRLGGVTLELAAPLAGDKGTRGERAWGLAYRIVDVDAAVARLRAEGVPVGDARAGIASGTRVCTVKWSDRVPTLLIEHAARTSQV